MKNKEHQAEIYACLWMLISEEDENNFLRNQDTFLSYWHDKEPDFVAYYRQEYLERAGSQSHVYKYIAIHAIYIDKWAMCYRHFDHSCTDTNMLVERLE